MAHAIGIYRDWQRGSRRSLLRTALASGVTRAARCLDREGVPPSDRDSRARDLRYEDLPAAVVDGGERSVDLRATIMSTPRWRRAAGYTVNDTPARAYSRCRLGGFAARVYGRDHAGRHLDSLTNSCDLRAREYMGVERKPRSALSTPRWQDHRQSRGMEIGPRFAAYGQR